MADTLQDGIAAILRADAELSGLLPGGVWTRRIRRNDNGPELPPTPGSTPEAFDEAGRIRRCVAVLNEQASTDPLGPTGAYSAFPEIWLRCLPQEREKTLLEQAARRIIRLVEGAHVAGPAGEGILLGVAGRMMPDDDPTLTPAVVDMIRVQATGVWR